MIASERNLRGWTVDDLLTTAPDVSWITADAHHHQFGTVGHLVPPPFERYVRVFHPTVREIDGRDADSLPWATVARMCGAVAHAEMQWDSLTTKISTSPLHSWAIGPSLSQSVPDWWVATLAAAMPTSDCYFAIWEGNTAIQDIPALRTPIGNYRYMLTAGSTAEAPRSLHGIRPTMWWSTDRSWLVVSNCDLTSTYIGASAGVVEQLLTAPGLEVWPTDPNHQVTRDADRLNST